MANLWNLHTGSLELSQTDQWLLHVSPQDSLPLISRFVQTSSSGMNPGCSIFIPLQNDGGHFVLQNLWYSGNVFIHLFIFYYWTLWNRTMYFQTLHYDFITEGKAKVPQPNLWILLSMQYFRFFFPFPLNLMRFLKFHFNLCAYSRTTEAGSCLSGGGKRFALVI